MKLSLLSGLVSLSFMALVKADLDPIVIKGSKFFYKTNGTQFFIRGVAYQRSYPSLRLFD
jgi:1,3-beta-glucanosyltransferase GAS1